MDEITEGFAAARGLALPSQLRHLLRAQGRDLHAEFERLLPGPPRPIRVQRWSARRVGLWALVVALLVVVGGTIASPCRATPAMGDERRHERAHGRGTGPQVRDGPATSAPIANIVSTAITVSSPVSASGSYLEAG